MGLRSHYVASVYAYPLLKQAALRHVDGKRPHKPLIAHISSFGGVSYSFSVAYGVGKAVRYTSRLSYELVFVF